MTTPRNPEATVRACARRGVVNAQTAYLRGWDASKRTTACDLDAAEARYSHRYGRDHEDAFTQGWVDVACDRPFHADGSRSFARRLACMGAR